MFEKLSDKKFITPTQFGNYLKEIYDNSIQEFQQSKAKMIQDTKTELTTLYNKQIENLQAQLKAVKDLSDKTLFETKKNHAEEIQTITNKLKSFEEIVSKSSTETQALHLVEINNLKKQLNDVTVFNEKKTETLVKERADLISSYQKQLDSAQSKPHISIAAIIIGIILGLFLGAILFSSR